MLKQKNSLYSMPLSCALVALAGLSGNGAAHALDDAGMPVWNFSGFGTVGAVHSSERQADFADSVLKASGAGFTHAWSGDVDSRLGAQLDLKVNPQWSFVLQMISEQSLFNSYAPIVEWANIKYQWTPNLSVRLGRIALPVFLAADYRKVGYALPWVRTPVEVYGSVGISSSDGMDVNYRWRSGVVKNVLQAFHGHNDIKATDTSYVKVRGLSGISNTSDYGAASVRVSLTQTNLTIDLLRPLFDPFRIFGPQGVALADKYDLDHKRTLTFAIGASYDPGDWFVMSELGHIKTKSYLGDRTAFYASSGYRFAYLTPYVTYSEVKPNSNTSDPGLSLTALSASEAGYAAALNAGLNTLLASNASQKNLSAGVRWDLKSNLALKLQYDRVMPQGGSPGTLLNVQPGFKSAGVVNVASIALDFVY